jgi:hypothetical protein
VVRRILRPSIATSVPGVSALAALIARIAAVRSGRTPLGLIALLPVAVLLDVFDAADELFLGPVGMAGSFVLETAFVLGVTGRPAYALGFAALDLVPLVDVVPVATLTLVAEIARAYRGEQGPASGGFARPEGPVIDV